MAHPRIPDSANTGETSVQPPTEPGVASGQVLSPQPTLLAPARRPLWGVMSCNRVLALPEPASWPGASHIVAKVIGALLADSLPQQGVTVAASSWRRHRSSGLALCILAHRSSIPTADSTLQLRSRRLCQSRYGFCQLRRWQQVATAPQSQAAPGLGALRLSYMSLIAFRHLRLAHRRLSLFFFWPQDSQLWSGWRWTLLT